jgi:hypothetical protein
MSYNVYDFMSMLSHSYIRIWVFPATPPARLSIQVTIGSLLPAPVRHAICHTSYSDHDIIIELNVHRVPYSVSSNSSFVLTRIFFYFA